MNPLIAQFVFEARDFLQGIGNELMALEAAPDDMERMTDLFRLVHTLKGNSGLFDFPAMTRLLHAGEDLMDAVRDGRVGYSRQLADALLQAMDLVGVQVDEIDASATGVLGSATDEAALASAAALRAFIPDAGEADAGGDDADAPAHDDVRWSMPVPSLEAMSESERLAVWDAAGEDLPLYRVRYVPDPDCFFKGEDPFFHMRQLPGLVWGGVQALPWPALEQLDCYSCRIVFDALARADLPSIREHFRYVPEQVQVTQLPLLSLAIVQGRHDGGPVCADFAVQARELLGRQDRQGLEAAIETMQQLCAPDLWLSSALCWMQRVLCTAPQPWAAVGCLIDSLGSLQTPQWPGGDDWLRSPVPPASQPEAAACALNVQDRALLESMVAAQAQVLALPDGVDWLPGRLQACAATLKALLSFLGQTAHGLDDACAVALREGRSRALADWLSAQRSEAGSALSMALMQASEPEPVTEPVTVPQGALPSASVNATAVTPARADTEPERRAAADEDTRPGRRAEDTQAGKVLKVEQFKVDRLMNLIGEMVVAKNSLPYLANRAENLFGVRELAREIKAQYAVINRIAEEMQDAIMQVRMMPVSFVFQRFPRMVRDISHKLGKQVELVLEGEDTEADKNIVETLADPLVHIVRNSLDHGLESGEDRLRAGKPQTGRLVIRASQESDRVVIEVIDDGKGIDPAVIKRKAYEKGVIDEALLERISDQEAINLVFAAGFSTAEQVSDLSGRGVGMDVVRSTLEKVGGTVQLFSAVGRGTTIRLTLPLSMAVTNVMIIESDGQIFGLPMDSVVETVRLPMDSIRAIKQRQTIVLRGKIVPVMALNELLAIDAQPRPNADQELAALVVRIGADSCALLVDDFREVVDVILKPLPGELAKLRCYAGTALLGDGAVLMVLNPKELL